VESGLPITTCQLYTDNQRLSHLPWSPHRMLGKLIFLCRVLIAQSNVVQRVASSMLASEKDHAGPGQCKAALSRYARLVVSSEDELIDVTRIVSCSWAPASAFALPKLNLPPRYASWGYARCCHERTLTLTAATSADPGAGQNSKPSFRLS
jgi:hypothetical protein